MEGAVPGRAPLPLEGRWRCGRPRGRRLGAGHSSLAGMAAGWRRSLLLLALLSSIQAIHFPCITPHPDDKVSRSSSHDASRDSSLPRSRSRTPDSSDTIAVPQPLSRMRGGDTTEKPTSSTNGNSNNAVSKVLRSPRARSESGIDSWEDSSIFDAIGRHRFPSNPPQLDMRVVVRFRVNYSTRWGENVVIVGSTEELGGMVNPSESMVRRALGQSKGKVMRYVADGNWEFVTVLDSAPTEISYRYALVRERGDPLVEGGAKDGRTLDVDDIVKRGFGALDDEAAELGPLHVEVRDQWRVDRQHGEDVLLRTDAFRVMYGKGRGAVDPYTEPGPMVIHPRDAAPDDARDGSGAMIPAPEPTSTRYRLVAERTRVPLGQSMAVESEELFGAVPQTMLSARFPVWELDMEVPESMLPVKYRYVVVDDASGEVVDREAGAVRWLGPSFAPVAARSNHDSHSCPEHCMVIVRDEASTARWPSEVSHTARVAGLSVSLQEVASDRGEMASVLDIKRLIDICAAANLSALHLESLSDGRAGQGPLSHAISTEYLSVSSLLPHPSIPGADASVHSKMAVLRKLFDAKGKDDLLGPSFSQFINDNGHWLKPYGLHEAFREHYNTSDASRWHNHSRLTPAQIEAFSSFGGVWYKQCGFWYWIQLHLHQQMTQVSAYARDNGVALITDVRYSSARDSADAWARPELFKQDKTLATMPNDADPFGKSLNHPAYDWGRMKNRDGCAWWHGRIRRISSYFHGALLRDVACIFRQWEIFNGGVTGLGGRMSPCNRITGQEMESQGLWDRRRLCEPFVRERLLVKHFGPDWNVTITPRFFDLFGSGVYRFKAGVDFESTLAKNLTADPPKVTGMTDKEVFDKFMVIMNERCILRDEKAFDDRFYPRLRMHLTDSYQEFGKDWQQKLRDLHDAHFSWRQDNLLTKTATEKIDMLQSASNMMLCADETADSVGCAQKVLEELGIPGTRMALRDSVPYLCAATLPSGGDTVGAWYGRMNPSDRQRTWQDLGYSGEAPEKANVRVVLGVIRKVLSTEAMMAWIPFRELVSLSATSLHEADYLPPPKETPGRVSFTELATGQKGALTKLLADMVQQAGRKI
mmetsp:Transcript_47019/g.114557  ORF Transcript_47019/g.114557 Transcript_47019/m.114557 type:complete len:1100 (+) Transcript_47019:8-3307(+)